MGAIIRLQTFIDPENLIYALFVIHAILTPLEGFLMTILFIIFSWRYRSKVGAFEDNSSLAEGMIEIP